MTGFPSPQALMATCGNSYQPSQTVEARSVWENHMPPLYNCLATKQMPQDGLADLTSLFPFHHGSGVVALLPYGP